LARCLAGLVAPLAIGAAALAWYNWARFGSVVEFGLRYQLTVIDFNRLFAQAFSIRYVADNFQTYLINPFRVARAFPFLTALPPERLPPGPASGIAAAEIEPVTGLLLTSPFLVVALFPILRWLSGPLRNLSVDAAAPGERASTVMGWICICLGVASALSFSFLLLYFYPTMRQLEDVIPSLAILAALGFWQGWWILQGHPWIRASFAIFAAAAAVISIVVSSLLAVTSYDNRFLHLNRELLRQMIRFFGR
jgi:hypothetical protein